MRSAVQLGFILGYVVVLEVELVQAATCRRVVLLLVVPRASWTNGFWRGVGGTCSHLPLCEL